MPETNLPEKKAAHMGDAAHAEGATHYRLKTPKGVERAVVGTYQKIEDGVVGAYKGIEKRFIDAFLEPVKEDEEPGE